MRRRSKPPCSISSRSIEFRGRLILLPAAQGFTRGERRIANLSYYVWPAIHDFAQSGGDQVLLAAGILEADGLWLPTMPLSVPTGCSPLDWLGLQRSARSPGSPTAGHPYFGFSDAVRIPLGLGMAQRAEPPGWPVPRLRGRFRNSAESRRYDQPERRVGRAASFLWRLRGGLALTQFASDGSRHCRPLPL